MKLLVLLFPATVLAGEAFFAKKAPQIDGVGNDMAWKTAAWVAIDQLVLGQVPNQADFQGRYKVVWNRDGLFILAEINDDVLIDSHPNPLDQYWEDDCLEVFIDEDASGGEHTFSDNAFAYHIALDNQIVDLRSNEKPGLLNEHVTSSWKRANDGTIHWELAIQIFDQEGNIVDLSPEKVMGFMVAYCDSDQSGRRESFMSDVAIQPINGDKNRGWQDASVFGKLVLKGP